VYQSSHCCIMAVALRFSCAHNALSQIAEDTADPKASAEASYDCTWSLALCDTSMKVYEYSYKNLRNRQRRFIVVHKKTASASVSRCV